MDSMDVTPWVRYPEQWNELPWAMFVILAVLVACFVVCLAPSAVAFYLAYVGKAKRFAIGLHVAYIVLGAILFAIGLYALYAGQPPLIWIDLLLVGGVFAAEMALHIPLLVYFYRRAEKR